MITRRALLRGLGFGAGAALVAPLVRRAEAGDESPPPRFVFVVEGNCIEPTVFTSPATRAAINAQATANVDGKRWFHRYYGHTAPLQVAPGDLGEARALDPLLGGDGRLDLTAHAAAVLGLSSRVAGGGHTTHHGALSCARSTVSYPGGPTVESALAALPDVRRDTPFDALRLGIVAANRQLHFETCAFDTGRPAPIIVQPDLAFQTVFGSVADAAGRQAFQNRRELLDFAAADVKRARDVFAGGSREQEKLETYLASIETLVARQDRLEDMEDVLTREAPEDPTTNPLYSSGRTLDRLQAQFDVVTSALLGGLTHVAVLASGTGYPFSLTYQSILPGVGRHDLHHGSGGNPTYLEAIHDVSRAHVAMIADMARTLASVPEGDGTVLDNTIIVYMPDNGEQHHSTASEWPILLVGGHNLGFQTDGRTVVYPGVQDETGNRQVSNLFNTLGHAAGAGWDTFGGEGGKRIAEGPLSEVWG